MYSAVWCVGVPRGQQSSRRKHIMGRFLHPGRAESHGSSHGTRWRPRCELRRERNRDDCSRRTARRRHGAARVRARRGAPSMDSHSVPLHTGGQGASDGRIGSYFDRFSARPRFCASIRSPQRVVHLSKPGIGASQTTRSPFEPTPRWWALYGGLYDGGSRGRYGWGRCGRQRNRTLAPNQPIAQQDSSGARAQGAATYRQLDEIFFVCGAARDDGRGTRR